MAVILLICLTTGSAAFAQLETRSTTAIPKKEAFQVVTADFNGDGKLDLAVTDASFSILLGNGDGTFQQPVNYSYSGLGTPMATADFNGDGKADLVIANYAPGASVLLGNGDGTFQPPITSPTTQGVTFIAVGDFNNDKKQDLLVLDPPCVSVLLGNGDGTFQAPQDNCTFPVYLQAAAVADFNNDGNLDVVAVGYSGSVGDLGVFLGNGDGTLQNPLIQPTNYFPSSVAAGDFNKDGKLDVAVAEADIGVFLGDGNGTFQPEVDYAAGTHFVRAADMNGDGKLDLVCGSDEMIGNGDGTFQPIQRYPVGKSFWWALTEDFNGDHRPDVIVSDPILGEHTLLNTGVALFSPSGPISFPVQLIGTRSSAKTIKITNIGTTALNFTSMRASGAFQETNGCGRSVAAGANCSISATFSPAEPGSYSGLIKIVDSASSKPQYIEVFGSATALKITPTSIKFGDQKVGTRSSPKKITVINEAKTTITFTTNGIGIGGLDSRDFSDTQDCGSQLGPGASCSATITFQPTMRGTRNATAYFEVEGGTSPTPVILAGTGT